MKNQIAKDFIKKGIVKMLVKKEYDPLNNQLIFADPRGGSTWLMEIIQSITKDPIVWEPLHLDTAHKTFKKLDFAWRQHIPEEVEWQEAKEAFQLLFSGQLLDYSILQHASINQIISSNKLLFKICRGNALLPWLTTNFPFNFKPIYMVRHPFAVVSSQLKHGKWNDVFTQFQIPETPHNEIYLKHKSFLNSISTKEEALVATWCISNKIALNNKRNNLDWISINYEEFVLHPTKTMERIAQEWNMEIDCSKILFNKNSSTTRQHSVADQRLNQWESTFNNDQINNMQAVLDYFEISSYSREVMPHIIYNYG